MTNGLKQKRPTVSSKSLSELNGTEFELFEGRY